MNCPTCNKDVYGNSLATLCPHCGGELPLPAFQSAWISWPRFFALLFAPAVGCFLAIAFDVGFLAMIFGVFGSLASGLICARVLMQGINYTGYKRSLAQFLLALSLVGLAYMLCFLGCASASMITNHGF